MVVLYSVNQPLPLGAPVPLISGRTYRLNFGAASGQASTVRLYFRDKAKTFLEYTLSPYLIKRVSGTAYSEVMLVSGNVGIEEDTDDAINPNLFGVYDASLFGLALMDGAHVPDSVIKSIQAIVPRRGFASTYKVPVLSLSVAAGASVALTNFINGLVYGTKIFYTMAISQDTLGTSPHASYLQLFDAQTGYLIDEVVGAVNSPTKGEFTMPLINNDGLTTDGLSYAYANGDSVAHWFYLFVQGIAP